MAEEEVLFEDNIDETEEKERGKFGLTKQQQLFAELYVLVNGLNGVDSVVGAGYKFGDYSNYPEDKREWYINLKAKQIARHNLKNPKICKYIKYLQDNMGSQIGVNRFYVIEKLKNLAEKGTESTQLKALELLGKSLAMFTDVKEINDTKEDPAAIMKKAFEERVNKDKVVNFPVGG